MITKKRMKEALDLAVFRGATYISEDVYEALQAAIDREDGPAKEGLRRTLQSVHFYLSKNLALCFYLIHLNHLLVRNSFIICHIY